MTIKELLLNLETHNLDNEVLLSHTLGKPREYILANPDEEVCPDEAGKFKKLIERRLKREPVAYLIKQKEFYGRPFYVDLRVHIPKPATEDMVDAVKNRLRADFNGAIADIGTGSGCVAITLALEFPRAKIIATDISQDALDVARRNAKDLNVADRITFLQGDLLEPLGKQLDVIAANLPYGWQDGWTDDDEVFFQPRVSYDGGRGGLKFIKKLIKQLPRYLTEKGCAFLEFDPRQTEKLSNFEILKDSEGHDRIAFLTKSKKWQ